MKANEHLILSECVENGVNRGWLRAFKHLDMPSPVRDWLDKHEDTIKGFIDAAVIDKIDEYFTFEEPKED